MRESDDLLAQLKAKLAPANIRATLAFAGLFQLTHELIKRSVLDEVKGFYGYTLLRGEPKWLYGPEGQRSYEESVLALAPGSAFRGSLLWLKESDAITSTQVELLDKIYRHRHDLTHELGKYLVDRGQATATTRRVARDQLGTGQERPAPAVSAPSHSM